MQQHSHSRCRRRTFLWGAGTLAFTPWIVPSCVLGADGSVAPSNRITLGFIGIGMMGRGHLSRFLQYPEAQVVAVCDVDTWRRENAKTTVEEAYASQRQSGVYHGCATYNDLRELLARGDIDAVVIATGDRWHAPATVMAAKAGKDIYCEKPAALTIAEAQAMVEAVRRYGRVCQIGLQQRSAREFRQACQLVQEGALGNIQIVYVYFPGVSGEVDLPAEPLPDGLDWDLWLGPAPWRPFNSRFHHYGSPQRVVPWDFCRDFGGGNLTSNAVHSFDIVQWALGMDRSGPVEIIPPETGQYPVLTYKYPGGVLLQVTERRLDRKKHVIPKGWDEITSLQNFGAVFVGEHGWIHVGRNGYFVSFPPQIAQPFAIRYEHSIAVDDHRHNWLGAIRTRRRPACDVAVGCQSTIVSHLGCIAHWTGRALKWDPAHAQFLADDEANRMRRRAMREPWRVLLTHERDMDAFVSPV
jgi:predicted dehydrogenase